MTSDQIAISAIVGVMVALFIRGNLRHDFVAVAALLACVVAGLVPAGEAFNGFGHPAVITVAGVLILSGALQSSGAAGLIVRSLMPVSAGPRLTLIMLTGTAAVLSAFMNNVGALALLMPVAVQLASRQGLPAGRLLMPMAFGSILGGMTTLIGTPPNLIVAGFRAETGAAPFSMFDFTPVGLAVTGAGLIFIVLFAWRLVPARRTGGEAGFDIGAYLTEARVPEKSKAVGMTPGEIGKSLEEADAQILGLIRDNIRVPVPDSRLKIEAGDILVIEADPGALRDSLSLLGLKLEEAKPVSVPADARECPESLDDEERARCQQREMDVQSDEVLISEMVVFPYSRLIGRTVTDLDLRGIHHINLLAVSRRGTRTTARLRSLALASGDVLLLQGESGSLSDFARRFGLAPLLERPLRLPRKREAVLAGGAMIAGVGLAALGILPPAAAFAGSALLCVLLKLIPHRRFYEAVDWPVVVLLGALIPVAHAVGTTGTASLIGKALVEGAAKGNAVLSLSLLLIATMVLTSVMSNAATAAVMCPVAISSAQNLGASADPFLMAVAIGASCSFITPISHQNNTLILGPGGFRFGDYWPLGLPLQIAAVAVGVPVLLLVWPL